MDIRMDGAPWCYKTGWEGLDISESDEVLSTLRVLKNAIRDG